ncbi:MAG: alpha/beta hydrolase-fold protein [Planctomycetota bacterium]|nr:hypothetical protein [Planctomycetaceae bacterium]MDQ3331502.1 alpha/beta hydrolase-fold protein [Planctomycetota bacterium]
MAANWNTAELAGHTIEVFAPEQPKADVTLLILPDFGERVSASAELMSVLAERQLPAVAPAGESCWWLDRPEPAFDDEMTAIGYLIEHVVPFIEQRFGVRPPGVKLLGRGVGGQGVLQLAFRRPKDFPAVATIDPAIDFHELHGRGTVIDELFPNREAARQQTALLRLHPAGWPRRMRLIADRQGFWFGGADKLEMKLKSMGIPIDTTFEESGDGDGAHFFEMHVASAVAFLLTERIALPVVPPDRY